MKHILGVRWVGGGSQVLWRNPVLCICPSVRSPSRLRSSCLWKTEECKSNVRFTSIFTLAWAEERAFWRSGFCNLIKSLFACGSERPILTAGVWRKIRIYCRAPSEGVWDKPQMHFNLSKSWAVFSFFFLKGKIKEVGLNYHLMTFFFFSRYFFIVVLGLRVSLVQDSLAKCSIAQGSVSTSCPGETTWVWTLMMISTTTVVVIWLWLISVQLAQDWGLKGQERK